MRFVQDLTARTVIGARRTDADEVLAKLARLHRSPRPRVSAVGQQPDAAVSGPPGPERDELRNKARHADAASHMEDWTNSSGLQPPK